MGTIHSEYMYEDAVITFYFGPLSYFLHFFRKFHFCFVPVKDLSNFLIEDLRGGGGKGRKKVLKRIFLRDVSPHLLCNYRFENKVIRPILGKEYVAPSKVVAMKATILWQLLISCSSKRFAFVFLHYNNNAQPHKTRKQGQGLRYGVNE